MNKIIFLLLLLPLLSVGQESKDQESQDDSLRWVLLPVDKAGELFNQCSRANPKYQKIIKTDEEDCKKGIALILQKREVIERKLNNILGNYTYQLAGYQNKKNDFIYFNCGLTDTHKEKNMKWKENPIITCDGSTGYWGVSFNIKTNELILFQTNGPQWRQLDKL